MNASFNIFTLKVSNVIFSLLNIHQYLITLGKMYDENVFYFSRLYDLIQAV